MPQIKTFARQAWQLRQQGFSIDYIAHVMGQPSSSIERWLIRLANIDISKLSWYDGLDVRTASYLRHAGIDSREALVQAWEQGQIKRGSPRGIGLVRLMEIRKWLEASDVQVSPVTPKAVIVDLSPEAEAALVRIIKRDGKNASELISELLLEHDAKAKER